MGVEAKAINRPFNPSKKHMLAIVVIVLLAPNQRQPGLLIQFMNTCTRPTKRNQPTSAQYIDTWNNSPHISSAGVPIDWLIHWCVFILIEMITWIDRIHFGGKKKMGKKSKSLSRWHLPTPPAPCYASCKKTPSNTYHSLFNQKMQIFEGILFKWT